MAEQPPHPWIGTTCGNYILRQVLDQGGVGMVFIAEHQFLSDRVALKMLLEGSGGQDGDLGRRFFQEAKATRAISHPNVVQIRDFGEDRGRHYLVMELLQGMSLNAKIQRGAIPEAEVVRIATCVAAGLDAAHSQGIIHRDLKPGNIFMCSDGQVKLLDFGMAKLLTSNASAAQTAAGMVVGTPQYMAPEQITDRALVGPRTDIYGLGAVVFKMLTGRLPFMASGLGDLIAAHLNEMPPRPSTLAPVSPEMEALVLQCLAKTPNGRPSSMAEVCHRLDRIGAMHRERAQALAPPSQQPTQDSATIVDAQAPAFLLGLAERMTPEPPRPPARISKPIVIAPVPTPPRAAAPTPPRTQAVTPIRAAPVADNTNRALWIVVIFLGLVVLAGAGVVFWQLHR